MHVTPVMTIEKNVDRAASALFAAACAYAAYGRLVTHVVRPLVAAEVAALAALAYLLSAVALGAVRPKPRRLRVAAFDVREIDLEELPELLLTERYEAPEPKPEEPLLLDDILAELEPDSRVVRLFDPASMPTPGQLKSRIDHHLDHEASLGQNSEAVQALHDALAELRRSLR